MASKKLKILFLAAEVAPFSKSGGLGDVTGSLPKALKKLAQEVVVVTPFHGVIGHDKSKLVMAFTNVTIRVCGQAKLICAFLKGKIDEDTPIYFLDHYEQFGKYKSVYGHHDNFRFLFFSRAALELAKRLNFKPDIVHCHDWHTAIVPNLLKTEYSKDAFFKETATVLTIHNLAFQGEACDEAPRPKRDDGWDKVSPNCEDLRYLNFMRRGINYADALSAVSENYTHEILTRDYGEGLHRILGKRQKTLFGITNGIDYQVYNPKTDGSVRYPFDSEHLELKLKNKLALQKELGLPENPDVPLLGMVSRITEQKGFGLLGQIMPALLKHNIQLTVVGAGERSYMRFLSKLAKKNPTKVAVYMKFSAELASRIYAGSDLFLMPSRFEPCGLGQLISLRYGSIPIVRATGGLVDTIVDFSPAAGEGMGFVFYEYQPLDFLIAVVRALENFKNKTLWKELVQKAMRLSFSWRLPAKKYLKLYNFALKERRK